jgi:hypothetical protein
VRHGPLGSTAGAAGIAHLPPSDVVKRKPLPKLLPAGSRGPVAASAGSVTDLSTTTDEYHGTENERAFDGTDTVTPACHSASVRTGYVASGSALFERASGMPKPSSTTFNHGAGPAYSYVPTSTPPDYAYPTAENIPPGTIGHPLWGANVYSPKNFFLGGYPAQSSLQNSSDDGFGHDVGQLRISSFDDNPYTATHSPDSQPNSTFITDRQSMAQQHPNYPETSMWQTSMNQYSTQAPPSGTSGSNPPRDSSFLPDFPQGTAHNIPSYSETQFHTWGSA